MKKNVLKNLLVTPIFLVSCQGSLRSDAGDEELLNLKPLQAQTFRKNADESWNNDTRLAYAGYYYILGEYLSQERNTGEAESLLELANDLDPNEFLAFKVLVAKISAGKEEEARSELQRLVILYPRSARFHALYGAILAKFSNFDLAVEQLELAISIDPNEEKAYLQLIAIYQQQNESAKSLGVSRRLSAALPRSAQGQLLLSHLLHEKGKKKEALEAAKQAYALNPTNPEASLFYAQLLELSGDKSAAIAIYDQLFSENPSLEELLSKTVALYRTFGDLNEIYARLVSMASHSKHKSVGIEIQKALVLWELNRNQEALNVLLRLQEAYPDSEQVLYLSGLGYEKLEDFNSAVSLYERVKEDSTFYLPANFQVLRVMEAQKRFDLAYKTIQKLVQSRYAVSEIYIIGANLYAKDNRFEEAIALLKEGYKKFPDQIQLIFLVGVFQEKAGQIGECVQSMRTVIHKDPNYSPALNYLGYIWAERGIKLDLAKNLIERALSLKPNDGFYLDSLGWVYYQKGDFQKSAETLINATRSEPEEGVILEHLGDVYLKLEKKENAEQIYDQALKKNSLENRDRERIEGKLLRLKNRKET